METLRGVIRAWNLMRGEPRWKSYEAIAEFVGIDDIEQMILGIECIGNWLREKQEAERRHA